MVLPSAHGVHPDGDPFAEQDQARNANTALGRMEARAKEEERIAEGGLPSTSTPIHQPLRSKRNTSSLYGSPRIKETPPSTSSSSSTSKNIINKIQTQQIEEVIIVDDSDESQTDEKEVVASTSKIINNNHSNGSGNNNNEIIGNGKGKEIINNNINNNDEDVIMQDSNSNSQTNQPNNLSTINSTNLLNPPSNSTGLTSEPLTPLEKSPEIELNKSTPSNPIETPLNPSTTEVIPAVVTVAGPSRSRRTPSPVAVRKVKKAPKTIRLEIDMSEFDGKGVPEFSIADMAIEAGFNNESEEDDEEEEEEEEEGEDGKDHSGSGSDGDSGSGSEDEEGNKKKRERAPEDEEEEKETVEGEKEDGMEGVESTVVTNGDVAKPEVPVIVQPPKKRRARPAVLGRLGGYDVEDPFVDDTELSLYEPQWYHRPKQEGYHVCQGVLELISDTKSKGRLAGSKNKPKLDADGKVVPARRRSKAEIDALKANGTIMSGSNGITEVVVLSDDDDPTSTTSVPAFGGGAVKGSTIARKKKPVGSFSQELQNEFDMLKHEISLENWEAKGKFPPRLRPILVSVALKALELEEYDDDFFLILPKLFPYNLFTMKKLVKREIAPIRISNLLKAQEGHYKVIKEGVGESLDSQMKEFRETVRVWKEGRGNSTTNTTTTGTKNLLGDNTTGGNETPDLGSDDAAVASALGVSNGGNGGNGSNEKGMEVDGVVGVNSVPATAAAKKDEEDEPKFKFKFSDKMRSSIYGAYHIEDEISDIIIERQDLEKATKKDGVPPERPHSILLARKNLYAKIASFWPEGLMATNQLSREVSLTKKRLEREKERLEKEALAA